MDGMINPTMLMTVIGVTNGALSKQYGGNVMSKLDRMKMGPQKLNQP